MRRLFRRVRGAAPLAILLALAPSAPVHASVADRCLDAAARVWSIPPLIMRAVARHESRKDPGAFRMNRDGSVDIGLMQINSVHLPELARMGLSARALANPCVNAWAGGLLLNRQVRRFGGRWSMAAVGAYHAPNAPARWPAYTEKVGKALIEEWLSYGKSDVESPLRR